MASKSKLGKEIRKVLCRVLPFNTYLWLLSKSFLLSYNFGLLKSNPFFEYHYFVKNIVRKGDVCIDIGANLGYFTVPMARIVGKQGMIYSVEPVKPALKVLRSNTKRFSNVKIFPVALGSKNDKVMLGNRTMEKNNYIATGSNFVMENKSNEKVDVDFEAEMRKGSELFQDLNQLDFIKCDVEGYEINIIPEMKDIIFKFRPVLLVESNGENRRQLIDLFSKENYNIFILNDGRLHSVKDSDKKDLIIIPEERLPEFNSYLN